MTDVSTSSSASFVNEQKMDHLFRMYENYVEKLVYNEESDEEFNLNKELSFEEDDMIEKFMIKNGSERSPKDTTTAKRLSAVNFEKLIDIQNDCSQNGFEEFFNKLKKQKQDLENDDDEQYTTSRQIKSLDEFKNTQELVAFIFDLINRNESYPDRITAKLKSKFDQLLKDLHSHHESVEQHFQKRLEWLEKQTLRSETTLPDKLKELFDRLEHQDQQLAQAMREFSIVLEIFPNNKNQSN